MVELENAEKGFQPFFAPGSMTWGARSFRRRGAHAHRSPGDGACQKQAAERSISVGPSLGGFGPCCFLGAIPESSVIALGGELAVARRHRFPQGRPQNRKKPGNKKAAQSLARGSADDAARWHGSFQTRTAGTLARGSSTVKNRASLRKECRGERRRYGSSGRARASSISCRSR